MTHANDGKNPKMTTAETVATTALVAMEPNPKPNVPTVE